MVKNRNIFSGQALIVIAIPLLMMMYSAFYLGQKKSSLNTDKQEWSNEASDLKKLRDDLRNDIFILQEDFEQLLVSNDSIEIMFANKIKEVEAKQLKVKKLHKDYAKDPTGISKEIQQLRKIKKDLNALIGELKLKIKINY